MESPTCPPRAKSAGATANSAQTMPVNNPQPSNNAFSATTISIRCDGLKPGRTQQRQFAPSLQHIAQQHRRQSNRAEQQTESDRAPGRWIGRYFRHDEIRRAFRLVESHQSRSLIVCLLVPLRQLTSSLHLLKRNASPVGQETGAESFSRTLAIRLGNRLSLSAPTICKVIGCPLLSFTLKRLAQRFVQHVSHRIRIGNDGDDGGGGGWLMIGI